MVNAAIEKYLEGGGVNPFALVVDPAIAFDPEIAFDPPMNVFVIYSEAVAEGRFAVMPLQTALDLHIKTIWVNTYDVTNGIPIEGDDDE